MSIAGVLGSIRRFVDRSTDRSFFLGALGSSAAATGVAVAAEEEGAVCAAGVWTWVCVGVDMTGEVVVLDEDDEEDDDDVEDVEDVKVTVEVVVGGRHCLVEERTLLSDIETAQHSCLRGRRCQCRLLLLLEVRSVGVVVLLVHYHGAHLSNEKK